MDDDLPVGVYAIFDIKYTRMLTNSLCVSRLEHFYWETMVTNDQVASQCLDCVHM